MFKLFKKENIDTSVSEKISKKLKVQIKDFDLISYDRFLFAYLFVLAVKDKRVYLFSSDNKKIEEFSVSDINQVLIDKKTDLNLYLKGGKVINLTSVVGVKPKVMNLVRAFNEALNNLK